MSPRSLIRQALCTARTEPVALTISGHKQSWFRCPECQRKVTVKAAFPLRWNFKTCGGCGTTWTNTTSYLTDEEETWIYAEPPNYGTEHAVTLLAGSMIEALLDTQPQER